LLKVVNAASIAALVAFSPSNSLTE
jgi:hypothetical protein